MEGHIAESCCLKMNGPHAGGSRSNQINYFVSSASGSPTHVDEQLTKSLAITTGDLVSSLLRIDFLQHMVPQEPMSSCFEEHAHCSPWRFGIGA